MTFRTCVLATASVVMLTFASACTTTEKLGNTQIMVSPDGTFAVVDEDGNPSDDPDLNALAAMLSAEMAKNEAEEETDPKNLSDDAIWLIDVDSNRTHIQSGGMCPLEWSQFTLNKPIIFNQNGLDVGCSYLSQPLNSSFTFYFYKNSAPVGEEINGVVAGIQARVPTAKAITDVITIPTGDAASLYQVRMLESVGSDGVKTRNGVFLTDVDGWRLKLRVTYPTSRAIEIEALAGYMIRGQMDQINANGVQVEPVVQPGSEDKLST